MASTSLQEIRPARLDASLRERGRGRSRRLYRPSDWPNWPAWSAIAEEFTEGTGLRTHRSEGGDPAQCQLPPAPDLTALNLVPANGWPSCAPASSTTACSRLRSWGLSLHRNASLADARPLPRSCRELAALGENRNGIYLIDPDGRARCRHRRQLRYGDGGWTLVAAQFESNPVSWNAGVAPTTIRRSPACRLLFPPISFPRATELSFALIDFVPMSIVSTSNIHRQHR